MTETSPDQESKSLENPLEAALDWNDPPPLPLEEVSSLFVVLGKALRAQQLYDENNPVYQRFVSQLGESLAALWSSMDRLPISVDEDRFTFLGDTVYQSDSRADSLAFLLYKDGIREFTLHQGLEQHELSVFLQVLNQARDLRPKGDDLLTILWEKDLKYFTYTYIDILAEGVDLDLPAGGAGLVGGFGKIIQDEVGGDEDPPETRELGGGREESQGSPGQVSAEEFNPTLYSLDPTEIERIQGEIRIEMARDLRGDVLAALFDRVEEPRFPERQQEILEIFQILLPNFLSRGALSSAGDILEEISGLLDSEDALRPEQRATAEDVLNRVSGADTLKELIQALEDGSISPDPIELGELLKYLRAEALGPLLRGAEEAEDPKIKATIQDAVAEIAREYSDALMACLESSDPAIVAGAVSLAGRMQFADSAPLVSRLLGHREARVRLAAIEAAKELRASMAIGALRSSLSDSEREVRIAAARALGELQYSPAAPFLRSAIEGKEIRQADISEQIAFFESYGMIRDPDGVRFLDGLLNGRGFFGKKESGEIRACAALGLGKIGTTEAMASLEKASREQDPVVRSAVNRALRGEGADHE